MSTPDFHPQRPPDMDMPPAATAGSPGTSLFLPRPSASRAHSTSTVHLPHPSRDQVPIQWSFESSYGLFGSFGGAVTPSARKEPPESLGSSWFGRKRDKDRSGKRKSKGKSVDAAESRVAAPRSVTPPPLTPRSPLRLPSIPASNAPTRPPSPAPTFRPTAANRPGSASGFRAAHPPPPTRRQRRPATSSGVPSELGLVPAARASRVSLAPSSALSVTSSMGHSVTSLMSHSASPQPSTMHSTTPSLGHATTSVAARRKLARERGFAIKRGKRHHPLPRDDAPYPRDYSRKVLDHEIWENAFAQQLVSSNTFHAFDTPPARVLDLGCGTGAWILDCARAWPDTHFTGLDLVPIQPPIPALPPALAPRIRWVHANFLQRLPFPDGAFDYVHVRRVARGVPEDRWDALLEEVVRVMRDGAAFEMVEEELWWPGSVWVGDDSCEEEREAPSTPHTPPPLRPNTAGSSRTPPPRPANPTPTSRMSFDSPRPPQGGGLFDDEEDDVDDKAHALFHAHTGPAPDPRDHSLLESAYIEMHAARFINLTPLSVLHSALGMHFPDVRSHAPIQVAFPESEHESPRTSTVTIANAATAAASAAASPSVLRRSQLVDHSQVDVTVDMLRGPPTRLPNMHWRFDVRALTLHLSARVAEVLACAESMWEFVLECRARGGCAEGRRSAAVEALGRVSREEWEECLVRYEMDMQDRIGMARALEERLGWRVGAMQRTAERRAFDDAVAKWEKEHGGKGAVVCRRRGRPLSRTLRAFVAWKGP